MTAIRRALWALTVRHSWSHIDNSPSTSATAASVPAVGDDGDNRRGRDSLCTQPVVVPRSFHRLNVDGDDVQGEVVAALYAARDEASPRMSDDALAQRIGEVLGRMRSAAKGNVPDNPRIVEPVRRNPDLWELKWDFAKLGKFRMYHAEPGSNPDMVALRFHLKDTSSKDDDVVERLQNAEMDTAGERFTSGVKSRWGHVQRGCTHCVSNIESNL